MAAFTIAAHAASTDKLPVATPPGITIQPLGKAQGYAMDKETTTLLLRDQIAFADASGRTLYTRDADPVGKSLCVDDCPKTWPPALAPARAKAYGAWSIITRSDGAKQWALKGKPLYTFVKDVDIGSIGGNSPKRFGKTGGDTDSTYFPTKPKDDPLPEGWTAALIFPASGIKPPPGIGVREVEDAMGLVLVNEQGRTLYAFDGDPNKDRQACGGNCADRWVAASAPMLAQPVDAFAVTERTDGIRQWTYKSKGLYTYAGDLAPGDANGQLPD
ncbi:MAG: hypothetical protein ACYCZX_18830, partial [Rhodospirillaceae bacterium]